jgi:hypothetical protein
MHIAHIHRQTRHRGWRFMVTVLVIGIILSIPNLAHARPNCITAPELCVGPLFREYWGTHNGAHTFGAPIGTTRVYYLPGREVFYTHTFERAILEYIPARDAQHKHQSAPVGQMWYDVFQSQLTPLSADEELAFQPGIGRCAVVETQRPAVCGEFLDYYQKHGLQYDAVPYATRVERLGLLGVPLTPVMKWTTVGGTRLVQVFSHARLDYLAGNAADNKVVAGNVVVDLLEANVPLPHKPSDPINYLVDTGATLFDDTIVQSWRKSMPTGYWQTSHQSVQIAVSSFTYHEYFYSVRAHKNMKYVAFTMQISNMRTESQTAVYLDHSYVSLIDVAGNRYAASPMLKYLAMPFSPTSINAGTSVAGQLIFEIPYDTVPAQIEVNFANLDSHISRFGQIVELRVAPRN